ncbi:MAG: type IV pilus modification protein PilV [Gammaproteobacteria bacterium]|nr:type IV pilus modification protein PilV [Gammaproteobacteria bacterium]
MNKQKFKYSSQHRSHGFTLIEVLVAIVVLSIGLLGLAGLQATSLRNNNSALQRSVASILANDMLDRIRANRDGLIAGDYDTVEPGAFPGDPGCVTATPVGCTTAQMAAYDVFEWGEQLNNLLPSGNGKVEGAGANSVFTITIMWDDNRDGAAGTSCANGELTCFSMSTQL